MRASGSSFWTLEPGVDFLNHGSFGATPRAVQAAQSRWRARLEAQPVRFFQRELEPALDSARQRLAAFLGARDQDLAFVPNATTGVNAVVRSYPFVAGDEILITDHVYNACRNVVDHAAQQTGARVVIARLPFPLASPDDAVQAILDAVGPRTRLALVEHITSPTALVLPAQRLVAELKAIGVETLVDGAHAPGMIDLDIDAIGATFYTGNCHKWLCAPKGAGFLHIHPDHDGEILPAVLSHGYNTEHAERSRFHVLFDWTGTDDPTAYLSVPAAIDAMSSLHPDGWAGVRSHNRDLALEARDVICDALDIDAPAPDEMIGSMASIPLPDTDLDPLGYGRDPLQDTLHFEYNIEVPLQLWPTWPHRLIRISAQAYNKPEQYQRLAAALTKEL
jgi:isopenicillin-N epimerase